MKRVIRRDVFETNSSSSHTVSIRGNSKLNDYYHISDVIEITLDEYGWSGDPCYNFRSKLAYALSMVLHTEYPYFCNTDFTIEQDVLESLNGYQDILNALNTHGNCKKIIIEKKNDFYPYGYIDHQSYEHFSSLQDFLNEWGVDIERFLFDDNVVVWIMNDNG